MLDVLSNDYHLTTSRNSKKAIFVSGNFSENGAIKKERKDKGN
jgi:hypothetical protein